MIIKDCRTAKNVKIGSLYAELTRLELDTANVERAYRFEDKHRPC